MRTLLHLTYGLAGIVVACVVAWQWEPTRHAASIVLQSTAVLALVVGLAVQGTLTNAVAGLVISISQPIRIGDTVTILDHTGVVTRIGLSYTRIDVADGSHVEFPNTLLAQHEIAVTQRPRPHGRGPRP